jgi:histidinol-phosphate aminotransferase
MAAPLRPQLAALHAYQPEPPAGDAPLDANESPLAPPAAWMERARAVLEGTAFNRYPDAAAAGLRQGLGRLHGLPPESLVFGNGSDELLGLLLAAFGGEGARVLLPKPTFSMYKLVALGLGWQVDEVDLGPAWELTSEFVAAAKALKPRLIFLASPNNPTGNALDSGVVDQLRALPGTTLVMDEAYADFGGRSLLKAAAAEDGLVVLRTFSKAWGLANLRLGWLACRPDLAAELEKLRLPYNLNGLSQALGAEAVALAPQFLERIPRLLAWRDRLKAAVAALPGAQAWPSDANFVLLRHPDAAGLHRHLLAAGLRVRRFEGGRLEGCIRINAGDEAQTVRLELALKAYTQGAVTA